MKSLLLIATTLLLLGAVACAGGGSTSGPTNPGHTQAVTFQVMLRYSVCAREHGAADFPDPAYTASGSVDWPLAPGLSHLPPEVRSDCDPILNDLPADARIGEPAARPDLAMLRRFAQCMRAQPQMSDWPDPDASGTFRLPADMLGKGGPRQDAFIAARQACARFNPSGQLQLAGPTEAGG